MSKILDAEDELNRARDLVQLIEMAVRHASGEDPKAISAGCEVIEERFRRPSGFWKSSRPRLDLM